MEKPPKNRLLIICGLSFAGKSTLAQTIRDRYGYAEVDVDVTKVDLFGPEVCDEDLHPEDWKRIYAETDRRIAELLRSGKSVVDASRNFSKAERMIARSIAGEAGVPLLIIYVDMPEQVARQRLVKNRETLLRRDVSDSDFEAVVRAMQPPEADEIPLIFHYREDSEVWLAENGARLALPGQQPDT